MHDLINIPSKRLGEDAEEGIRKNHHPVLINILSQELGCKCNIYIYIFRKEMEIFIYLSFF
jgi:hypothetical protein